MTLMLVKRAAVASLACLILLGCTAQRPPWPQDSSEGETIQILTGTDTSNTAGSDPAGGAVGMYDQLANWWNTNEGFGTRLTIKFVQVPGGATAEHSAMLSAAQSHDAQYDIYNLDSQWVDEFATNGYIKSLAGQAIDTSVFLPQPLATAEGPSGELYALPFTTDVGLLYYRSDLVSPSRLAKVHTFRELMGLAASIVRSRPAGVTEGYVGQFDDYEGLTVNALEAIWSRNKNAFGGNGTVADQAAVSAGLSDLANAFTTNVIPSSETTYQEEQAAADFADGKAVFMRNWPIWYTRIKSGPTLAGEPEAAKVVKYVHVQAFPFPSVLGGQDLAVATSSRNPNAALKVIQYLTSASAERCLLAVGGFPATQASAYSSSPLPSATSSDDKPHAYCGAVPSPGFTAELRNAINDALQEASPRPSTPYYTEFTTIVQAQVCNFLSGAIGGTRPSAGAVASSLATGLADAASGRSPPQNAIAACSSLPWTVSRPCSLASSGFEPLPAHVASPRLMTGTSA
jgi:multiple sugar transport system substrate-binding protein